MHEGLSLTLLLLEVRGGEFSINSRHRRTRPHANEPSESVLGLQRNSHTTIRAYCFLPSRVMITGTSVPSGSASDFWTMRNSLELSSKTMVVTEVRASCPDS